MSVQRVASRYTKSLLDLSIENNELESTVKDIMYFNEVAKNRDFILLLKSPIINASKKIKVFEELFSKSVSKLTLAFFNIIIKKGREPYLAEIAKLFIKDYRKLKHISTVKITSATKLSENTLETIKKKLIADKITEKNIEIITAIDPSLLGGFKLEFDDKLYDASLAHKLEGLKKEFLSK